MYKFFISLTKFYYFCADVLANQFVSRWHSHATTFGDTPIDLIKQLKTTS